MPASKGLHHEVDCHRGDCHKLLLIAYTLLQRGCSYQDLGGDYFDRLRADGLLRSLVRGIERLGHSVVLQPATA